MPYDILAGGLDVLGLDVLGSDWGPGSILAGADADLQQLLAGDDISPGASASAQLAATATAHPAVSQLAATATQAATKAVQAATASHPAAPQLAAKAVQAAKAAASHPAARTHAASKMVAAKAAKHAVTAVKHVAARQGRHPQGGGTPPGVQQYLARQSAQKQAALRTGTREIAMRHAQAIVPRDYTRGRKLVIGIGTDPTLALADPASTVAAGASRTFSVQPQIPFKPDRFFASSAFAGNFAITDIKVGQQSMFAASSAVPAQMFAENSVDSPVNFDTAQISQQLIVQVVNISAAASRFLGSFRGFSAL
jgi:hypothetical protein